MKLNRGFIIFLVTVLVLIILSQYLQPRQFVWRATFSTNDRQPLGSYVFDSVMHKTLGQNYVVTRKTFYQLNHDEVSKPRSILVVTDRMGIARRDIEQINSLLQKGNRIMIVTCYEYDEDYNNEPEYKLTPKDSFIQEKYAITLTPFSRRFGVTWDNVKNISLNWKTPLLESYADSDHVDTIHWQGMPTVYKKQDYKVEKALDISRIVAFDEDTVPWEQIATVNTLITYTDTSDVEKQVMEQTPVAVRQKVGKGELILVSTPLFFTNYGILNRQTGPYVMRLMTMLADRQIVRTTSYKQTEEGHESQMSPMRELLKRPPLRHAFWLAMIGVLLFFIFTARRRQRIIPVIERPENNTLEFVKMIGTLYFQKRRNTDLVVKRWIIFVDDVRRLSGIDISDEQPADEVIHELALKSGIDESVVKDEMTKLRSIIDSQDEIKEPVMRHAIDVMNNITDKLK